MKLKITPGKWGEPYYDDNDGDRGWWINNGEKGAAEYAICVMFTGNPNAEKDAHFIREAGTVANECDLMPRELLAQRDDAITLLALLLAQHDEQNAVFRLRGFDVEQSQAQMESRALIARVRGDK